MGKLSRVMNCILLAWTVVSFFSFMVFYYRLPVTQYNLFFALVVPFGVGIMFFHGTLSLIEDIRGTRHIDDWMERAKTNLKMAAKILNDIELEQNKLHAEMKNKKKEVAN